MSLIKVKYLKIYTDRHGVTRHYFRRTGFPEVALPGEPLSEEFMTAYQTALSGAKPKPKTTAPVGSVQDILLKWYSSAKFKGMEPETRYHYRQLMERELADELHKPLNRLESYHIEQWMDDRSDRPGAAKTFLKRLKTFLRFAAKRGFIKSNPAQYVDPPEYETDGFTAWTDDDAATYERKWPLGTKQHLAYALMVYTGQRISDAAKMGRQDVQDGYISVHQAKIRKGKKRVKIKLPMHPSLEAAIAAHNIDGQMLFLMTEYKKPYSVASLGQYVSQWAKDAGLDEGKTSHGLRKLAGARLAEAGCSEKEIMAVLGISSIKEAALYTSSANQKRLAGQAMDKLQQNKK